MAPASARIACVLVLLCVVGVTQARFIIAGDKNSADNSWTEQWDYTNWMTENPLYEGDVIGECADWFHCMPTRQCMTSVAGCIT